MMFDIGEEGVEKGKALIKEQGLVNTSAEVADGCNLPADWSDRFDVYTTWDVVHDVPNAKKFVREVYRVLKPGGLFLMVDVRAHSSAAENIRQKSVMTYGFSVFHCLPVSTFFEGSEALGTAWGVEKQAQYLQEAGFEGVKEVVPGLHGDFCSYFVGYKPT